MPPTPRPFFRNLVTTIAIGGVVFWLGFQSAERGVFKFKRDVSVAPVAIDNQEPKTAPEPTPTPLPAHFPAVAESEFSDPKDRYLSLHEAYAACWPQAAGASSPSEGEITALEVENLFGKIKKREILSKSRDVTKLGLIFDKSKFPAGAAGSATEIDGQWTDLRFRAAGRMLHCENPGRCECI